MPVSILIVVDLPAPLGPMYPISSPLSTLKLIPLTADVTVYSRVNRVRSAPSRPPCRFGERNVLVS